MRYLYTSTNNLLSCYVGPRVIHSSAKHNSMTRGWDCGHAIDTEIVSGNYKSLLGVETVSVEKGRKDKSTSGI